MNQPVLRTSLEEAIASLEGIRVSQNERLSLHTSMGVGGPARWFIVVDDRASLVPLINLLNSRSIRWMMLGGGSNTLFSDEGFNGAVLHPGQGFRSIEMVPGNPQCVRAGAAANVGAIMQFAKRRGLEGLEFCAGIPGTLGGALAGNAGAGGHDICSATESVEVLNGDGTSRERKRGEFQFRYRWCELRDEVILGATLALTPDSREAIEERIQSHLAKRLEQPVGDRSSGCMFKNPPGEYAGRLIDRAGLKGLTVGGISVSHAHANFMINDGSGTAAQIRELMELVRQRVLQSTGVSLEAEVRFIHPPS